MTLLYVSMSIAWLLGVEPTEDINTSHCGPFCAEILLRINWLFASKGSKEKKDNALYLLYPILLIVRKTPEARQVYANITYGSIPTRLWLDLLRGNYHWVSVCIALRILTSMVETGNKESPFNRIWTYHKFFKSSVELTVQDQQLLAMFLDDLPSRRQMWNQGNSKKQPGRPDEENNSDDGRLSEGKGRELNLYFAEKDGYFETIQVLRDILVAMGMTRWSENPGSKTSTVFINAIIFGLQDTYAPSTRISALHAAWAYSDYIRRISDGSLGSQLFSALLNSLGSSVETVSRIDIDEPTSEFMAHLEQTIAYHLGLIHMLLMAFTALETQIPSPKEPLDRSVIIPGDSNESNGSMQPQQEQPRFTPMAGRTRHPRKKEEPIPTVYSLLDSPYLEVLPNIATYVKGSRMNLDGKLIMQLLEIIALINDRLLGDKFSTSNQKLAEKSTQMKTVWAFICHWTSNVDKGELFFQYPLGDMDENFVFYVSKVIDWTGGLEDMGEAVDALPMVDATALLLKQSIDRHQRGNHIESSSSELPLSKAKELYSSLRKLAASIERHRMESMELGLIRHSLKGSMSSSETSMISIPGWLLPKE
ncbi:hypothetical protein M422DRAFT_25632 [Sphaerobolus stellatus SS14]|nr:hypothetical protein M422DRAFT_25632 [Sphaerobolus stellatus SS14]